jgi:adenosylcobinamide amidohydrolase
VILHPAVETHRTGGGDLRGPAPVLVWRFASPVRCLSSAVLGGGLGERSWISNATVGFSYDEPDPAAHARRIATGLGLGEGPGVGLLTAVDVGAYTTASDGGAEVVATTGLGAVTWAAAPDGQYEEWRPGTVNLVAWVPEPVADPALVNLVATLTEAKVQALGGAGVPATGTPTDAVAVCCPALPAPDDEQHRYGGPRSTWGARLARAAHEAVVAGIARDRARPR